MIMITRPAIHFCFAKLHITKLSYLFFIGFLLVGGLIPLNTFSAHVHQEYNIVFVSHTSSPLPAFNPTGAIWPALYVGQLRRTQNVFFYDRFPFLQELSFFMGTSSVETRYNHRGRRGEEFVPIINLSSPPGQHVPGAPEYHSLPLSFREGDHHLLLNRLIASFSGFHEEEVFYWRTEGGRWIPEIEVGFMINQSSERDSDENN